MRVKQSRSRSHKIAPAPMQQRRKRRRSSRGSRGAPPTVVTVRQSRTKLDPMQWLAFVAIGLTSIALIALIWTLTGRAVDDEASEVRARTDLQVKSVSYVLGREIEDELRLVDQSLAIVQDDWRRDSDSVDLGAWRKQLLALTNVTDDIFIANEKGVIVQGTLPQSVGMGFGTAYVTYPNGSLETFNPNGTPDTQEVITGDEQKVQARQFLMYILRPITRPRGWFLGASYRSEGVTKLFAGAHLGAQGVVGLVDLKRGALQAIVGSSAQFAAMDISDSGLIEQMRKENSGIWAGVSPTDGVPRIIGYQRVADRPMAVLVGISADEANQSLAGLVAMARSLAVVASIIVAVIAGIVVWGIATGKSVKLRRRLYERTDLNLANARQEITVSRARGLLTEAEVGTLMSSRVDGVARLDAEQRLRLWNSRFTELVGVALDASSAGMPIEELLRQQARAGVFGDALGSDDAVESDDEVAKRLTVLHTQGQGVVPPTQHGPNGESVSMHVRGVFDGGTMIILAGAENALFAALPPLPGAVAAEAEPETADETTEW
jgi:PAS domain-containing protein